MFVLLIDLLMFMVLLLFVHTLSAAKWSLCRLEGIASEIGHSDPAQWWAGVRKTDNMVIVDEKYIGISKRHWFFMLSSIGLCCHIPGCFIMCLIQRLAPEMLDWKEAFVVAFAVLALLMTIRSVAEASIYRLHSDMAFELSFAAAIRALIWEHYTDINDMETAFSATLLLIKLYFLLDYDLPKLYEPTPESGREALCDLADALEQTGNSWFWKLTETERNEYQEILGFVGKEMKTQ